VNYQAVPASNVLEDVVEAHELVAVEAATFGKPLAAEKLAHGANCLKRLIHKLVKLKNKIDDNFY
jgi:hypothetical protein